MFTALIKSLIDIAIITMPSQMAQTDVSWEIDKNEVVVGGCVTMIFDGTSRELAGLMLRINERPALKILEAGPTIRSRGKTYVLLSHDLVNKEGFVQNESINGMVRMVPIFHKLGTVTLTLMSRNETIGTINVNVIEPPDGSEAAIELMFPILERKRHNKTPTMLLLQLLMGADVSHMLKDWDDTIEMLHKELEIVSKHPDWSEIAAMTVADAEATVHYKNTIKTCREARDEGRELITKPPIPLSISQALKRNVINAYAKAIQDRIRKTIAARQWIPSLIKVPTPARP